MLKKYFAFCFLVLAVLAATPAQARPAAPLYTYRNNQKNFLTKKLINNEPVTYCIYLGQSAREITDLQDFEDTFKLSIKLWLVNTAQFIRLSGQEKELAPLLAVLEKEPNLQRLPECNFAPYKKGNLQDLDFPPSGKKVPVADLSVFFEDRFFAHMHGQEAIYPFFSLVPVPHLVLPTKYLNVNPADEALFGEQARQFVSARKQLLQTPNYDTKQIKPLFMEMLKAMQPFGNQRRNLVYGLQHELGHAFGLADQLPSVDNGDLLLGTVQPRRGIMDNFTTFLSCDDADGLVIVLQKALNLTNQRFTSFCQDGITFSNGIEEISAPKQRVIPSKGGTTTRTYYPQTADNGIYLMEKSEYVSTESEKTTRKIYYLFDFSRFPKGKGGFQKQRGKMKILDPNNPENRVPVGEHVTEITLGAGPQHRQTLKENYDDNGKLLSYTLEIYDEEVLTDTRTKTF